MGLVIFIVRVENVKENSKTSISAMWCTKTEIRGGLIQKQLNGIYTISRKQRCCKNSVWGRSTLPFQWESCVYFVLLPGKCHASHAATSFFFIENIVVVGARWVEERSEEGWFDKCYLPKLLSRLYSTRCDEGKNDIRISESLTSTHWHKINLHCQSWNMRRQASALWIKH